MDFLVVFHIWPFQAAPHSQARDELILSAICANLLFALEYNTIEEVVQKCNYRLGTASLAVLTEVTKYEY